ncbi:MAG: hypothetical protein ACRELB_12920 [Polyangiaceae bacterium]
MMRRACPIAVWLLFACSACSVPNVTFYDDDASADGSRDAENDDGISDAGDAAPTCPASTPPEVTVCCGPIACVGDCPDACSECTAKCTATQQCCARGPSISCHTVGATCP